MHNSLLAIALAINCISSALAVYNLVDHYNASNFFDEFSFFSDADPTKGFVRYLPAEEANKKSILAGYTNAPDVPATIYMGVDYETRDPEKGRDAIRVESKKVYTKGLFIADIKHMPGSICGSWPAFWTVGGDWPYQGEIDVLEGVNDQKTNKVTLHTAPRCVMERDASTLETSAFHTADCGQNGGFIGCGFDTDNEMSYGTAFNRIGGGVYVLEWSSSLIRVFFFPRHLIPSDILSQAPSPDPSKWGKPVAAFSGDGCDIDQHFKNHKIVFDTTFCGDWAGNVFNEVGDCKNIGMKCEDYVKSHPEVYEESFWELNALRVYQEK